MVPDERVGVAQLQKYFVLTAAGDGWITHLAVKSAGTRGRPTDSAVLKDGVSDCLWS